MVGSKLKQLYGRLNMSTDKLMGASVLASFGAPVAFAVFLSVLFILSFKNFTFQKIIEENSLGLVATSLGLAWLVSLFLTLTLTFVIYLIANLFGKKVINVGLVSVVCVAGFIMFAISRMDFRDVPDLGVPSFLVGLAAANAFAFSFLAFKWSKNNNSNINNIAA